jgi:hypothetical protein
MPSCRVYIRGSKERIEVLGDTIRHLRDAVAAFLATATTQLPPAQEIRIFGNDSPTELNDASPLTTTAQYTYTAFEIFTTVPTDLFRNVKLNQIHPVVDSDPECHNGFTRVSALFCTALTPSESEDPPFYMHSTNRVVVRGASLECADTSVPAATVRPADEVTATEPRLTRIPLNDIVFQNTHDVNAEIGILRTSYLYKDIIFPRFLSKTSSGNGPMKKRMLFWRYVIRRGTDLSSLGVSLVFDNANKSHFSLIPNKQNAPNDEIWRVPDLQRPTLLRRDPAQPISPPDAMPETISFVYDNSLCVAYPPVAQKFELHDFTMKAAGLVQFNGRNEDRDSQNLAQAAEIVFDRGDGLPNCYGIYEALDVLSSFAFDVKKVPFYDLGIFRNAMTDIQDGDDVGDAEQSVLSLAVKAIDTFFENCSEESPRRC